MNAVVAQWTPLIVMLMAIWFGLLYNNKRLDDFKDLVQSEIKASRELFQAEMRASEERIMQSTILLGKGDKTPPHDGALALRYYFTSIRL